MATHKKKATKKTEKNGATEDRVKLATAIVGLVAAILSIILAIMAKIAVESTRVETGDVITNSNFKDYSRPWYRWTSPVTEKTFFVGLQRKICFEHPFNEVPRVSTGIGLVDTKPANLILSELACQMDIFESLRCHFVRHCAITLRCS